MPEVWVGLRTVGLRLSSLRCEVAAFLLAEKLRRVSLVMPPTKESGKVEEAVERLDYYLRNGGHVSHDDVDTVLVELEALREALQRIAGQNYEGWGKPSEYAGKIARAALERPE